MPFRGTTVENVFRNNFKDLDFWNAHEVQIIEKQKIEELFYYFLKLPKAFS